MEEYIYCTTHTLVAVSLFFVILLFLSLFRFKFPKLHYFSNKDDKKRVPPTSMGWPFLGHTLLWFYYMAKSGPLGFLHKYILPYGEIVTCNFFGRPMVESVDPEFNKFVLQNESRLFKASYFKSINDIVGKNSFLSVTGDLQKQLHGIAVSLLNNEKLRSNFMPAIQDVFKQTMAKWEARKIALHHECKREEHEAIQKRKGGEEKLQWEDYRQMKFTQCVINETLRLSSIAVCLFRETTEDVTAKGYVIPKGWGVMTFLGAVHLNEEFYSDALTFDPWRWQAVDKEALLWKSYDVLFSPFGGGRRLCPGADLARVAISLFLHYFVTKFRWEIVKEGRITFFPIPHLEGGLPIRVSAKSPPSLD